MTQQPEDYSDLTPSIGDRLRIARERRTDLDQTDFAARISVSRGTVSNYERDKLPGGPRQQLVLNAWAVATGTTAQWLETGVAPEPPQGPEGQEYTPTDSNREPAALESAQVITLRRNARLAPVFVPEPERRLA